MTPARYTEVASRAAGRYQGVSETFRSLLSAAQAQPFSPARANVLRTNAMNVATIYLNAERVIIRDEMLETASEAVRSSQKDGSVKVDGSIPSTLEGFVGASESYLESEIRAQLSRDVEAVVKRYREFALQTHMVARSTGMPMNKAISFVAGDDRMRFQFRDRVGRLYPAQKFVRTAWRHTLVNLAAEFYMLESSSRGVNRFTVEHPDPQSRWAGQVIDLKQPDYLAVRDDVFHPNSNAILKAA